MVSSGIDPSLPSTYQMVEGNRAYGAVMNSGRGLKGNVTAPSNTDCDGYSSDVCDYNVEMAPNVPLNSITLDKLKSSDVVSIQKSTDVNVPNISNRFEADNSYVKADQRDRPVSMVSPWALKPMSPKMESSLYDRRQKLIQKRANVFRNTIPNTQSITTQHNHNNKNNNNVINETESITGTDNRDRKPQGLFENSDHIKDIKVAIHSPHRSLLGHKDFEDQETKESKLQVVEKDTVNVEYNNKHDNTFCQPLKLTNETHSMFVPSNTPCYSLSSSKINQSPSFHTSSGGFRTSSCENKLSDSCGRSSNDNTQSLRNDANAVPASSLSFPLQAAPASINNSGHKLAVSTDSELLNTLSSDSEVGTRRREGNKLSHQSSVDEISIDGANNSRVLRRSHSKSSTSGVQAKIARRKMMRQANAIDAPPPHLSSDQEMNTNDEEDSVEEKQDSEPINDGHSKKNVSGSLLHNFDDQVEISSHANNDENASQTSQSSSKSSHELTPEMGKNTNWTSRFSNIKNSFASEEDLSKSRSPSINRSIPATEEEHSMDRGRPKTKSPSPKKFANPPINITPVTETSITEQARLSQLRERPPSKEDKNKQNIITASGNNNNLLNTSYVTDTKDRSAPVTRERSAPVSKFPSPQLQPKIQPGVKKHSAPASLTVAQQQQQLPKSKQPTPNREPILSSGRVSKSLPREGRTYNDQSRAEVLGFVKSDREDNPSGGESNSKNSDMDYQEYMNIINRVRRTKEFSRVRVEQYKLASMYAKEKKRQEELKLEEERLQRERIKIEAEQKILEEQQDIQQHQRNQILTTQSNGIQQRPTVIYNNTSLSQHQPAISSTSLPRIDDNRSPQINGIEKGQLDNKESEQNKISPSPGTTPPVQPAGVEISRTSRNTTASTVSTSTPIDTKTPNPENADQGRRRSTTTDGSDQYHQEQLRLHNLHQEQAKQEQMRLEQIQLEQKRQQELRENQVRAEQEKLEKLREEQERQTKEREEIRRLEFERLQQIQEDQLRLEEERHRQQEHIRFEQMRLEEERKRQERIQAEKNALYNRQRLDMEAQNIALNEEDRVIRDRQKQKMFTPQSEIEALSPQEKIIQERLFQQDKLRQEHRKEETQIRQEKLNLIQQEETLITKQEELLRQIETEREKLRTQEDKIRSQQQERLQNVRQEKLLLEKQEEMLFMRKEQLMQERIRQEKLRDEQRLLREQEEAIKKRQEQICKELMGEIIDENCKDETSMVNNQLLTNKPIMFPNATQGTREDNKVEPVSDLHRPIPTKSVLSPDEYGFGNTTNTSTDATRTDNGTNTTPSTTIVAPHIVSDEQGQPIMCQNVGNDEDIDNTNILIEDDEEGVWSGSCSGSEDDTLDEDGYYESKVEVKQSHTSVPTTVRTIETKIDNPPWAPITPYLTYSEKQNVQTQEEVSAIFAQSKTKPNYPGVVTSPESLRTSTNLITTPESSISLHSQISHTPLSQTSSEKGSPPPPIPPLPKDDIHPNDMAPDSFHPLQPEVPPRDDSFKVTAVYTSGSENAVYHTAGIVEKPKQNLLQVPSQIFANEGSASPESPRIGGPGSAFKPYASNENLFDPSNLPRKLSDDGNKSELSSLSSDPHQNYPLQNGSSAKFTDSRFFMKTQNGKEEFKPPLHGKIRDLRKATIKPFSTTDTEPEMRECHLNVQKKGKQKVAVYSTSETEEEYQAYLRTKPKWHGKGGHKDSWDPLLIQSPPQITQRPVGIIQRPKAQNAPMPIAPVVIERGVQIDNSYSMYGNFYNNSMLPFNLSPKPFEQTNWEAQKQDSLISQNQNGQIYNNTLIQQLDQASVRQSIQMQKEKSDRELREKEAEQKKKELEIKEQEKRAQEERDRLEKELEIKEQEKRAEEERDRLENERKRQEELEIKEKEKRIQEERDRVKLENERKMQEELDRKQKIEAEVAEQQKRKKLEELQLEEKKRLDAQKEDTSLQNRTDKTPTIQRKLPSTEKSLEVATEQTKENTGKQGVQQPIMHPNIIHPEVAHTQLPIKKGGPVQQLATYERIQKSDSIIELREKQQAAMSTEQVTKSRSVRDLSKAFLDQAQNIIPQSVAEINRHSFLSTTDQIDVVKEPSPISPKPPRNNEATIKSPQYDSTSSNGMDNDDNISESLHSPVISRYSVSPRVQMSPKPLQVNSTATSQSNYSNENTRASRSKFNKVGQQKPTARHQSNPRKEMHDKLMNEALLQVELKKEKAKPKQPITRMNPTIAAMEIMTRKEIKMGEMEQRLARGELPQIPVPATPVHMKDQQSKPIYAIHDKHNAAGMEGVKTVGGQAPFNAPTNKSQSRSSTQHPGQGDQIRFHV